MRKWLSVLLAIVLLITSTAILGIAEEPQEEWLEEAEAAIIEEIEAPAEAEEVEEEPTEEFVEEPAEEIPEELEVEVPQETVEAPAEFKSGYVFVPKGTVAYDEADAATAIGTFSEDSFGYALATDEADWLFVAFDTEEALAAGDAVYFAYVIADEVEELTAEESEELLAELDVDARSYRKNPLPVAAFAANEKSEQPKETERVSRAAAITITKQPADMTVAAKATALISVTATGSGLTYQWQTKLTPTSSWANTGLDGASTATLNIASTPATFDGRQYRCVIKDNAGNSVTSNAMTLTVSTLSITKQPEDIKVSAGTNVSIKVVAEGNGLTYQWQTKLTPKHDWADTGLTGAKTDTLTFAALASFDGRQYRCVVKDNSSNSIASNAMTLTVSTLSITKQPDDIKVSAGTNVSIKVAA
ncbi:MAG: hypothetical protein IJ074_01460, partial [Clostridia bacterium]|nr:hypothetical protein [Clostridia bacterium]